MINFIASVLEVVILSSMVILAVLAIKLLFDRKLNIQILSLLWVIVLARLIIPVSFNSPIQLEVMLSSGSTSESTAFVTNYKASEAPANNFDNYTADYTAAENIDTDFTAYNAPSTQSPALVNNDTPKQNSFWQNLINLVNRNIVLAALFTVWLIGAWLKFFTNVYAIFDFNKKLRESRLIKDIVIDRSISSGKQLLGIRKNIEVKECDYITTPITYGLLRPKILLPKGFLNTIESDKLYLILLHELCHIKNRDILKNYLWLFARVVYWFNPLVAIAYKKYLDDIEYIADETVLQYLSLQSPIAYTESLLAAVKLANEISNVPVALSFCRSKSKLRKRVENMLKPQKKSKLLGSITVVLCAAIILTCFTTACVNKDDFKIVNEVSSQSTAEASNDNSDTQVNDNTSLSTQENTQPLSSDAEDEISAPEKKPLKSNPVGSKEAAIEIARSINISDSDDFTYVGLQDYRVPSYHMVDATNDAYTNYFIYDFNGEILYLRTSKFAQQDLGEQKSDEELISIVKEFAAGIYPNTELTITSCKKDEQTWEIEGETRHSRNYFVAGDLYDPVDGSIRFFISEIRLDGQIISVHAEYDGLEYMQISDEVRSHILSYRLTDSDYIYISQRDKYYNDHMLYFNIDDGDSTVTLLESDMSLLSFRTRIDYDREVELGYSQNQLVELAKEYAQYYFPQTADLKVSVTDEIDNIYFISGDLTDKNGLVSDFTSVIYGDGELREINIRPNVEEQNLIKLNMNTAKQNAINELKQRCSFVEDDRLWVSDGDVYKDEYLDTYVYMLEYTSDNPSIHDYSLKAQVHIDKYTGDYRRMSVEYMKDQLDLISKEEAIELAKGYIADQYNLDPTKLEFYEFIEMTDSVLLYQANFNCGDKGYLAVILPDTGESAGIGSGG